MSLLKKLAPEGKKKILSLDGGGILGLITVEILIKLEADLRQHYNKPHFVLSDFFDFVTGTSTGAIIATFISAGMSMHDIKKFYIDSGKDMFDKTSLLNRLKYAYNTEPLALKIKKEINMALGYQENDTPATLGNKNLKTVLMLMLRNHTTDSPWPVSNNPHAKYNQNTRREQDNNLNLPLWQLIRASTAAPTYFPPEVITFAEGTPNEYSFIFLDGGMTTYNNSAFLAFQMATTKPYAMNWKTGVDKLLIVSIGTGKVPNNNRNIAIDQMNLIHYTKNIPSALMNAASDGWDMACRTLGHCRFGESIDSEFGDMVIPEGGDSNWSGEKLFSYVRYHPELTTDGLKDLNLEHILAQNIQDLDSIEHIEEIQEVGQTYANKYLDIKHLGSFI